MTDKESRERLLSRHRIVPRGSDVPYEPVPATVAMPCKWPWWSPWVATGILAALFAQVAIAAGQDSQRLRDEAAYAKAIGSMESELQVLRDARKDQQARNKAQDAFNQIFAKFAEQHK